MSKENIMRKAYRKATARGLLFVSDEKVAKRIIENNMVSFFNKYDRNVSREEIREYINREYRSVSDVLTEGHVWPLRFIR